MTTRLRRVAALWCIALLATFGAAVPAGASGPPTSGAGFPDAVNFNGYPDVGALFVGPTDTGGHFCTASVVDSRSHNLIVTAGHCISGTATNLVFVPDYHHGLAPFGIWKVKAAYAAPAWINKGDTQDDFALLALRPQRRHGHLVNIQQVVGGNRLALNQPFRQKTEVVGYPDGPDSTNPTDPNEGQPHPIRCTNETYGYQGFRGFNCNGYPDGTSGGPFLIHFNRHTETGEIDGVIGGLHQGGCYDWTSYSAQFGRQVLAVLRTAERGGPGETLPVAGSDGC